MPYNPKSLENLKKGKATQFNGETAAKNGKKGSAVTNEKKKAKQREKEEWDMLLSLAMENGKIESISSLKDAKGKNITIRQAIKLKLITEALKGNIKAFEAIMRYAGVDEAEDTTQEEVPQDNAFIQALNAKAVEVWENENTETE